VWDLPVMFIVENNGYGLSTPVSEQFRCKSIADKGIGYGIEGVSIDGNNVLEVYDTVRTLAADLREHHRPVLIECRTFRMRGHEEASGTKYIPKELLDTWAKRDPLENFGRYLIEEGVVDERFVDQAREEIRTEIDDAVAVAFREQHPVPDTATERADVY